MTFQKYLARSEVNCSPDPGLCLEGQGHTLMTFLCLVHNFEKHRGILKQLGSSVQEDIMVSTLVTLLMVVATLWTTIFFLFPVPNFVS